MHLMFSFYIFNNMDYIIKKQMAAIDNAIDCIHLDDHDHIDNNDNNYNVNRNVSKN